MAEGAGKWRQQVLQGLLWGERGRAVTKQAASSAPARGAGLAPPWAHAGPWGVPTHTTGPRGLWANGHAARR